VDQEDAGLFPRKLEASGVGGDEVDEQEKADRVAAGIEKTNLTEEVDFSTTA
jgi:hypothetical protein